MAPFRSGVTSFTTFGPLSTCSRGNSSGLNAQTRVDINTPGRHTTLPLFVDEAEFQSRVRGPAESGKKSPLLGLDPDGEKWAVIESFSAVQTRG
jgi:hypothetical protein